MDNKIPPPCLKIEGKWLGSCFSDFISEIPKEHLLNQLYMFSKDFDVDEAVDNVARCSHFSFTEARSHGLAELSSKDYL